MLRPDDIDCLYRSAFPSSRRGALYNAFSYPTKISPEAIALFIATHTAPGDMVLDVFAGSGTTGIATKLCDKPTEAMRALAREIGVTPVWGPRSAVLYDVSVLGAFVAETMCNPPEPTRFAEAAHELVDAAETSNGWLYDAVGDDGEPGTIRYTIWSEVLSCPACSTHTSYWEAAVRHEPLRLDERFVCRGCTNTQRISACDRVTEVTADPLLDADIERRTRVPVQVHGRTGKRRWHRAAGDDDREAIDRALEAPPSEAAPRVELQWGDLFRSGYHQGISHLHHFYTPRNFLAVSALWELIERFDEDLRPALRMLVLSFNASHSTLMTRIVVKKDQSSFALTGAQSGVLYISGLPVEKNVFEGVRRKITTFETAFESVHSSDSLVRVVNASSSRLDLTDGSVSYVFTDPPFGDYIPYAELNQINEFWLGRTTDRADEAIMSVADGKDVKAYEAMLASVFGEVARVMADDAYATVVFHSAKATVWRALTTAYTQAGLTVKAASILDKTQATFKQTVSTISVKGDPILLLDKRERDRGPILLDEIIEAVLADADGHCDDDERTNERLFSRFMARCLLEGVDADIDARDFYRRAGLI